MLFSAQHSYSFLFIQLRTHTPRAVTPSPPLPSSMPMPLSFTSMSSPLSSPALTPLSTIMHTLHLPILLLERLLHLEIEHALFLYALLLHVSYYACVHSLGPSVRRYSGDKERELGQEGGLEASWRGRGHWEVGVVDIQTSQPVVSDAQIQPCPARKGRKLLE
jgi:hypothetical protein